MAIYKPPKLKNAKEFLTNKKVNRSSPEEYYEVTSQKFSLYDPDTAYSGSQRAKQEKESERRLSLPKVNIQEIRDNSLNQYAEYLPQEEVSRLNRIAHQGEQPKQSFIEKLTSNVTDENRATLGVKKKPTAPRINSQVATLAGKQPEQYSQQQSADGDRFLSDGNIKGQVANVEQKKESEPINWENQLKGVGRSLVDLPRNIGAAAVNTYDNLRKSGILPGGAQKQKVLTEEEFNNSNALTKKGYGTYENYLKLVGGLNESPQFASSEKTDKVVEGLQEKLPSKVDSDTTLWEKMVRGAATSWLPSMASASLGGGLAGMAGQFSSNPIIIEAMRTAPLFTSGTDSGLKTAEELGLTGAKKYSYAVLSGLLEAGTERLSSLGLEGKLLGKKTSGGVGGTREFLRAIFEESGSEMLNEVGQQLLTGQYTSYEDFELDFENIIVAGGSAALMGGFGAVGELSNGLKYRTVGTVDNQVIIETEDGRRENVNPEIVMRHQLANGRTARRAQEMLKADTEIQELAKNFTETEEVSSTMPIEDTTAPQEALEVKTEPSMPIEEKPLTEPLNDAGTVSVNEIDKVIGKPKGKKNVDYLEYYEVVKNFPEYAFKADDDFIDVVEGMEIQAKRAIEESIEGKDAFKAKLENGQYIIVHPSTKNGEVQVSFFDDKGAIMDEQMKRSELVDRLIEARVLPKDITDEGAATQKEPQIYTYTFRTRGLSPGAQPKGFVSDNPSEGKFGSVSYDRPLTEKEIRDYELVPVNKSIPPPETELQANEERLNNMIQKGLIDTKRKRDMAKSLNQKIVEQGGQDRLQEIEPKKEEIPKPSNMKYNKGFKITSQELDSGSIVPRNEYEVLGFGTEWQGTKLSDKPGYIVRENSVGSDYKTVSIVDEKIIDMIVERNAQTESEYQAVQTRAKSEAERNSRYEETYKIDKFTKDSTPMQKGKILQTLNKKLNYDGKVMTRAEFVYDAVVNQGKEVFTDINKKFDDKLGKWVDGKAYYGIRNEDNSYNIITKAEYEYAQFIKEDTDLISPDDDLMVNNMAMEAEIEPMDSTEPVTTDLPEVEMMDGYKTSATKKSLLKAPNIPQAYKDNVVEVDPMLYETSQRIARELEANQEIETKTYDVATKEVLANHKADPKLYQSKEGQAMIQALIKKNIALREQYKDNGFYQSQYEDLQKVWRETGTDLGQSLNMRKQLYGDTVEGKLIEAERVIEDSKTKEHKELEDRMNKIVDDIFEKTLELDENGNVKPDAEFDEVIADIKREFGLTNTWIQMLRRSLEEGTLTKVRMKEIIKEKMGIPTLTMAEVDKITEIMKRLDALDPKSETYAKDKEAILQDATMVYAQKDVTFWTKLSTYQTMAMLMNVKTTLRNEIGNLMGFTTAQVDDVFSFFFDEGIAKITKQRGTVNPRSPFKLKYKDGVKKSFEAYGTFLADASDNKYVKRRVFAPGSAMGKLEGAMGVMLSDARWKQPRVEFLLEQIAATEKYAKERGLEYDAETARLKENINFIADYDTFNFNSKPAQVLDGVVKSMNKFGNKDFGLGTLFAKFAKTPMNIIQYQLDHIGADLLREGVKLSKLSKKIGFENALKQNQGRISRALGKTATGMTYVTLGALLSNLGAFVEEEEDKDVKNILEAQGIKGGYFNFSALRRSITSGTPSSYKDGDTVLSVNWMLPVAPFLLLGSRFANAKDNKEAQDITDTVQSLLEAGGASLQDFAELPFNRTLGILTNSYDSRMDKVNKLAGSAITGFVPSVVKQVAQGIDPTSKQYSKKSGEAVVQQIKATIPGLRNTVPNRFDVTGETQTMTDNSTTAGNIFEMLLNPAYRDTIEADKDLQKVVELNKKVGLPSLPKITNGYFSYKSNRYEMTQDEHQEFQSVYWNAYKRTYNKKNDGNFVNAHDYAMNQAKINYLKKKKVKFETTSSGNLK